MCFWSNHRRLFKIILICIFGGTVGLALVRNSPVQAQGATIPCTGGTIPGGTRCTYMPLVSTAADLVQFSAIPVMSGPIDRPADAHGDVNLSLRSYLVVTATLGLLDINGPTDSDPPQLAGLFSPPRLPTFSSAHQVYDWDWDCAEHGCRGAPIAEPPVTLLGLKITPGELIYIPTREPQIYAGSYKAMVLYAEAERITLAYTRDDTPAFGYVVHLENLHVSPNLVALYVQMDAAGRGQLPALHNGESLGRATGSELRIAIRDTGSFMDPRSRKDWWQGY